MRNEKLKPCPFCGGEAEITKSYGLPLDGYVYVECLNCGASVRRIKISADYCANDKAVELWNKGRADDEFNNNSMQQLLILSDLLRNMERKKRFKTA